MAGIKLFGFNALQERLDKKRFEKRLRREVRRAGGRIGLLARRQIRRTIKKGLFSANAPLTIAIKRSKKALIDKGGLFSAITSVQPDWKTVFVGILLHDSVYDVAKTLHDGKEIPVTEAMRGLFWILWKASTGDVDPGKLTGSAKELFERFQDWKPLRPTTRVIRIPARPFIRRAFEDIELRAAARHEWLMAIERAIGIGAGVG